MARAILRSSFRMRPPPSRCMWTTGLPGPIMKANAAVFRQEGASVHFDIVQVWCSNWNLPFSKLVVEQGLLFTDEAEKGSTHGHWLKEVMVLQWWQLFRYFVRQCSIVVGSGRLSRLNIQEPEILCIQARRKYATGAQTKIAEEKINSLIRKDLFRFKKQIFWNLWYTDERRRSIIF